MAAQGTDATAVMEAEPVAEAGDPEPSDTQSMEQS
jgi:hypothetical protein